MTDKKQCSEKVWDGWHHFPCQRPAKVERDGKWYCGIHDPEYIKAKNQAKEEKWEAENKANEIKWAREVKIKSLVSGLTDEELSALTPEWVKASNQMYEALKDLFAQYRSDIAGSFRLPKPVRQTLTQALNAAEEKE